MTAILKAFHGDAAVKEKYLARVREHAAADEIIQGTGWENGKGCAVGCTLHDYNHDRYSVELGLPVWLARLEDTIFEGLPKAHAKTFPERFLASIPVGADLERVKCRFALHLLGENAERVKSLAISDELKKQVLDAIEAVAAVNREAERTGEWNESAAWSARSAAESAWSAAWSAESARSAAWSAWSAAWSAESAAWSARSAESARSAARSAAESARSAARSAAESAAYIRYADVLLELLAAA